MTGPKVTETDINYYTMHDRVSNEIGVARRTEANQIEEEDATEDEYEDRNEDENEYSQSSTSSDEFVSDLDLR